MISVRKYSFFLAMSLHRLSRKVYDCVYEDFILFKSEQVNMGQRVSHDYEEASSGLLHKNTHTYMYSYITYTYIHAYLNTYLYTTYSHMHVDTALLFVFAISAMLNIKSSTSV